MVIKQKAIAEKAGVSCATVSRALNNSTNVKPETIAKIHKAMEELGLNSPFKNQFINMNKATNYVLIVVGDNTDIFFSRIIKGICDNLFSLSLIPVLCVSNFDTDIEAWHIKHANAANYAGIIIITAVESESFVNLLKTITIPVILVNRYIRSFDTDVVCIDNYRGGYIAASTLIKAGHRKILHLTGDRNSTPCQDRLRGFIDAMTDANLKLHPEEIYYGDFTIEDGRRFVDKYFTRDSSYTAIYIGNNPMAFGAASRLTELGYKIPDDVSIICFDDSPLVERGNFKLTSISYDPCSMGHAAVEVLQKRLANPNAEKMKIIFSPNTIERGSIKNINAF